MKFKVTPFQTEELMIPTVRKLLDKLPKGYILRSWNLKEVASTFVHKGKAGKAHSFRRDMVSKNWGIGTALDLHAMRYREVLSKSLEADAYAEATMDVLIGMFGEKPFKAVCRTTGISHKVRYDGKLWKLQSIEDTPYDAETFKAEARELTKHEKLTIEVIEGKLEKKYRVPHDIDYTKKRYKWKGTWLDGEWIKRKKKR